MTHKQRFKDVGDLLSKFLEVTGALQVRLGPLLFQLPPKLKKDASRLRELLVSGRSNTASHGCFKPSHFEETPVRHLHSEAHLELSEGRYGESAQNGPHRDRYQVAAARLLPSADRPRAWASTARRCPGICAERLGIQMPPLHPRVGVGLECRRSIGGNEVREVGRPERHQPHFGR